MKCRCGRRYDAVKKNGLPDKMGSKEGDLCAVCWRRYMAKDFDKVAEHFANRAKELRHEADMIEGEKT